MSGPHKPSKQAPRPVGSQELTRQPPAGRLWKVLIRDRGFEPGETRGRGALGLLNMEEQAPLVGGSFTLSAQLGQGVARLGGVSAFARPGAVRRA
jgi:hypothetical protein